MKTLLLFLVRAYRLAISPLFPPRCRYLPSCSEYAVQAIERHGATDGGWLAFRRFLRCSPLHEGGIDEVPETLSGWRSPRFACRCRGSSPSHPAHR